MKKIIFSLALVLFGFFSFAQKTTYEKTMVEKIKKMEATHALDELPGIANEFARIAEKEKTQWLPYYYAALSTIQQGRMQMTSGKTEGLDAIADQAQKYLDRSVQLSEENAENLILQKMIYSVRMMVNPMARFMTDGAKAAEALRKAEELDPENPRITLLKGEDTFFTPEQFGGSKEKGRELIEKSIDQFKSFKPKSSIYPNWGAEEASYMLETAMQ